MKWDIPFTQEEMFCKCGCGFILINEEFIERLLCARYQCKYPFKINSWCRCRLHNQASGGNYLSSHLTGIAVDIEALNRNSRFAILSSLIKAGFTRIGLGSNFIHVDDDDSKPPNLFWFDKGSIQFK